MNRATIALCLIALSGCEIQRAQEASDAQKTMIGMPKEQVLACMGAPERRATAGATEVWGYDSGNGRTDSSFSGGVFGTSYRGTLIGSVHGGGVSTQRSCRIDVVISGDRVARVNYSGPTGGLLTEGEQCAFAVENCLSMVRSPGYAPQSVPAAQAAQPQEQLTPGGHHSCLPNAAGGYNCD